MENVKKTTKAGVLCTIDGETFNLFTNNTWICNLGVSCHITDVNTGLYDVTESNKLVQGSSGNMPARKRACYE